MPDNVIDPWAGAEARIAALERQLIVLRVRLFGLLLLLAFGAVTVGFLWYRLLSPVVEAQAFVLKDANGEVAYVLRVRPEPVAPPEGFGRGVYNRPFTVENGARREVLTIGYEGVKESR